MTRMRCLPGATALGLALLASLLASTADAGEDAADPWPATWTPQTLPQLRAAVADAPTRSRLLHTLTRDVDDLGVWGTGECELVDAEGQGRITLVCAMSPGNGWNTELVVVGRTSSRFSIDRLDNGVGWEIDQLPQHTVDLGRDGRHELLITTLVGDYRGARPAPTFTHVWKIVDGRLYRADAEFASYYRETRLPEIDAKLARLRASQVEDAEGPPVSATRNPADAKAAQVRDEQRAEQQMAIDALMQERAMISALLGR